MDKLQKIFGTKNPVIGMIHFGPLLGYIKDFNIEEILNSALKDLEALELGEVDGIMIENNYDIPHRIEVGAETIACVSYLSEEIIKSTARPVGVSVLWNDYKAALSVAKIYGGKFIRVPVFVDHVKTNYGEVIGIPEDVINYRKQIEGENILIFADIHVKHAEILNKNLIEESAKKAIDRGADGLILTGKWTGEAPNLDEMKKVRESIGDFPVLIGSGATKENIKALGKYADGVIISTSIKSGVVNNSEINLKNCSQRIDSAKTKEFVDEFRSIGM